MSLALRVQNLEELVAQLQQQVAELQARLAATSRASSFEIVAPADSQPALRTPEHTATLVQARPTVPLASSPASSAPEQLTAEERAAALRAGR